MSCFNCFSCFANSKSQKVSNSRKQADSEKLAHVGTQPNKKKLKEFLSSKSTKSVAFDLDTETCKELVENSAQKEVSVGEIGKDLVKSNVEDEVVSVERARDLAGSDGDRELKSAEVGEDFDGGNGEKESEKKEVVWNECELVPRKNRYENCSRDDESEDIRVEDADCQGNHTVAQGESSESLFSLSIDSRKTVSAADIGEKEVTSVMPKQALKDQDHCMLGVDPIARDRSEYVHSVLNPVKNLTQWKAVKGSPTSPPFSHQDKENVNVEQDGNTPTSPKPSFQKKSKSEAEENAVNTSLSSWLVAPETSPVSKNSVNSVRNSPASPEDRPILGALTVGDLKFSASKPPKISRSKSPEDMPIIGTVGSYWRHTGQTVDSDSSSSCTSMPNPASEKKKATRVKWNSVSFQERLEKAV